MAEIQPGDMVVDPMCGGGSIGIEVCKVVFICLYVSARVCLRLCVYVCLNY